MMAMLACSLSRRLKKCWGSPFSTMSPEKLPCWYTPARIFISVDLPAPFSPTRQWISPGFTLKLTQSSAFTPGKVLVMSRISNRYSAIGAPLIASCFQNRREAPHGLPGRPVSGWDYFQFT